MEDIGEKTILISFPTNDDYDTEECYEFSKDLFNFPITKHAIVEMETIKDHQKSSFEVKFYSYEKNAYFKAREEDLLKELAMLDELPDDEF